MHLRCHVLHGFPAVSSETMTSLAPQLVRHDSSLQLIRVGAVVGHAILRELSVAAYWAEKELDLFVELPAELLTLEETVLSLNDLVEVRDLPERDQGFGQTLLAGVLARQTELGFPLVAKVHRGNLGASREAGADLLPWYARHGF